MGSWMPAPPQPRTQQPAAVLRSPYWGIPAGAQVNIIGVYGHCAVGHSCPDKPLVRVEHKGRTGAFCMCELDGARD